nr:20S proteasome subunit beta type-6 [Andalucia godoyi]|eukprot:ANDGO_05080.mRNA.1 Proteasome subunit beta type-6
MSVIASNVQHIDDPLSDLSQPHSMGTTIIAAVYADGVILGADSRTSTGSYVANRASNKLTEVAPNIYCCRSGSAADTQAVSDTVRMHLGTLQMELGTQIDVATAAKLFSLICYSNKDKLMAGIIVAGCSDAEGPAVYNIPLGGSMHKLPYAVGGSGSTYVMGFCDANYRQGMQKDECIEFVRRALSHAMERDGSSGGIMRTVVITKDGVQREMLPLDKFAYVKTIPTYQ